MANLEQSPRVVIEGRRLQQDLEEQEEEAPGAVPRAGVVGRAPRVAEGPRARPGLCLF